jgi:hypothetical protein
VVFLIRCACDMLTVDTISLPRSTFSANPSTCNSYDFMFSSKFDKKLTRTISIIYQRCPSTILFRSENDSFDKRWDTRNCVNNVDKNFARASSQSYQQLRLFPKFRISQSIHEYKGSSKQSLLIHFLSFARNVAKSFRDEVKKSLVTRDKFFNFNRFSICLQVCQLCVSGDL